MKILMLSHTADFGAFKVGSHHLAREFARAGNEVVHLSPPVSWPQLVLRRAPANRLALARSGPVRDEHGVLHVVGIAPAPLRLAAQRRVVAGIVSRVGAQDAELVLLDEPLLAPLIPLRRSATVVYRPTDVYESGVRAARQAAVLGRVDAVIATSRVVLASLGLPPSLPAAVVENGVAVEHFASASDAARERSGAVYVGALDARFDWDAVRAAAETMPALAIELYGPVDRAPALPSNVRLHGAVPYDEVPRVLASARIGLLPFTRSPLNSGRSPMKFYEYLAAGLTVVASGTPVLRERNAPGVLLYEEPAALPGVLRTALELPAPNTEGQAEARRHGWSAKAAEVLDFATGSATGGERRFASQH